MSNPPCICQQRSSELRFDVVASDCPLHGDSVPDYLKQRVLDAIPKEQQRIIERQYVVVKAARDYVSALESGDQLEAAQLYEELKRAVRDG